MSSPPLRVFLKPEEDRTLWELSKASGVSPKILIRAQLLRLSSQGWRVQKIAEYLKCSQATVERVIHRWEEKGLGGLWDRAKTGRKKKWQEEDLALITQKIEEEPRSYNSQQLCQILEEERKVKISERQMRRILKKKLPLEKNKNLDEG